MSALITSIEHSLVVAASETVKVAKFLETSVLPVLKKAQADESTIDLMLESEDGTKQMVHRGDHDPRMVTST